MKKEKTDKTLSIKPIVLGLFSVGVATASASETFVSKIYTNTLSEELPFSLFKKNLEPRTQSSLREASSVL